MYVSSYSADAPERYRQGNHEDSDEFEVNK